MKRLPHLLANRVRSPRRRPGTLIAEVLVLLMLAGGGIAIARSIARKSSRNATGTALCTPSALDASALLPGTQLTVSPTPGARDASPQTQISLLGVPADELRDVTVTGSNTGAHDGQLIAYSQGDGASFVPNASFASGETVEVHGEIVTSSSTKPFSFQFTVAYPDTIEQLSPGTSLKPRGTSSEYQSFSTAPELHPPDITVTGKIESSGDIFAAPYSGAGNQGPMIFEPDGQLVWMDPLPENVSATNLQMETYEGKQVLTWWQGYIPRNGFGLGEEIVANSSYETIMHVHAGNGYQADLHDFHLEADNTAVLTVFDTIGCNLSSVGGPSDGDVTDALYQEIDLKTGLVRRQWTSIDHVALSASYSEPKSSAEWPFDYFHLNTVDPQSNGTTLLSGRNVSALYLIDDKTGQITTTIGGRDSSVTVGAGTRTAYQHDASILPNGDISIFDNGGAPFEQSQSRALVIELDTGTNTDRTVIELTHPEALKSASQGSVQSLSDGGWFVGWGQEPYFSEFNAAGEMVYGAQMAGSTNSYRAYKFTWTGTPTTPPAIAAERTGKRLTVDASWNGATDVASWRVLAGPTAKSLTPVAGVARSGFQTAIEVPAAAYVEVQALDSSGRVIGASATIAG